MRKPEIIQYKGHQVIYLDYSNLKDKEEIIRMVFDGSELIRSQPLNTVLSLVNMENMFFNNEIRNVITENVKKNTPHVKMSAVYGLNGLISIMFNSFLRMSGRNVKSFRTREDALEYLISEES